MFAAELAADRVPSVRAIRSALHVGQPRAQRLGVCRGHQYAWRKRGRISGVRRTRYGGRMRTYVKRRNEMTDGISAVEYADRRARLSDHVRALGAAGYVVSDPAYITYLTGFRFLSTERPTIYLQNAAGDDVIFVAGFELERTRAEADFDAHRDLPGVPRSGAPDADPGPRRRRPRPAPDDRGRPRRLSRDPRLHRPEAQRGDRRRGHRHRRADRGDARPQEPGRGGTAAGERPLVLARPPASAAIQRARQHRGRGQPARAERGDAGDAGRAGTRWAPGVGRRSGRLPGPDRPPQAWAHAVAHNIGFQPGQVLRDGRPSGATTRSWSARW